MAVTFVVGLPGDGVFEATTKLVAVPAGIAVGDFILVGLTFNSGQTITPPSGFTSFGSLGSQADKGAFWKVANSADVALSGSSGSWSFGCTDGFISCHGVVVYRGVNTSAPFAAGPTITSGNTTAPASASLSGTGLYVVGLGTENNSGATSYTGMSMTLRAGGTTPYADQRFAWLDTTVSGSSGARTASVANAFQYGAVAFVLAEAGGGGLSVAPTGIPSAGAVGTPSLTGGVLTVAPAGIASLGAVGTPSISGGATVLLPVAGQALPYTAATPAGMVSGKWTVTWTTGVSSSDAAWTATSAYKRMFALSADDTSFFGLYGNGSSVSVNVWNANVELLRDTAGAALTFSAGQALTFVVDPTAGTIAVSGATSGNGTRTIAPWTWPQVNIRAGDAFSISRALPTGTFSDVLAVPASSTITPTGIASGQRVGTPSTGPTSPSNVRLFLRSNSLGYGLRFDSTRSPQALGLPGGLLARLPGIEIFDGSFGGLTTSQLVASFNTEVLANKHATKRNIVLFLESENEMYYNGTTPTAELDQLESHAGVVRSNAIEFVALTQPPTSDAFESTMNVVDVGILSSTAWNGVIDTSSIPQLYPPGNAANPTYFGDATHLTDAGYSLLADAVAAGLAAYLGVSLNSTVSPGGIASGEALGTPRLDRVLSPSGVASAEALGTPALSRVVAPGGIGSAEAVQAPSIARTVAPTGVATAEVVAGPAVHRTASPAGIASAEAVQAATIARTVPAQGIATGEAMGAPSVTTSSGLAPSGVSTGEALGVPAIHQVAAPPGVASAEALGAVSVRLIAAPPGIATAEAFGQLLVALSVAPGGIGSGEASGAQQLGQQTQPGGIATGEAAGSPSVAAAGFVAPQGAPSAEAFGAPTIGLTVALSGVSTGEALGAPSVTTASGVAPQGIPSAEALGAPSLRLVAAPAGIGSGEAAGTPSAGLTAAPIGVPSAEALSAPQLQQVAAPGGVATAEVVGALSLTLAGVVAPAAIPSAEALGLVALHQVVRPSGVTSAEALGAPQTGPVLAPAGIPSAEAFGPPSIAAPLIVSPLGIVSAEALGAVLVAPEGTVSPAGIASGEAFGPGLYVALYAPTAAALRLPRQRIRIDAAPTRIAVVVLDRPRLPIVVTQDDVA